MHTLPRASIFFPSGTSWALETLETIMGRDAARLTLDYPDGTTAVIWLAPDCVDAVRLTLAASTGEAT